MSISMSGVMQAGRTFCAANDRGRAGRRRAGLRASHNLAHALHLAVVICAATATAAQWSWGSPTVSPTTHMAKAKAAFSWPLMRETVIVTVAEVARLTRYGASLNLFTLGRTRVCAGSSTPSPSAAAHWCSPCAQNSGGT